MRIEATWEKLNDGSWVHVDGSQLYTQSQAKLMHELLSTMTALTKLKYGNSDEAVYSEIEKAEKLLNELKESGDDN